MPEDFDLGSVTIIATHSMLMMPVQSFDPDDPKINGDIVGEVGVVVMMN